LTGEARARPETGEARGTTFSVTNQYQVADQISWTHGKHTFRTGGELG